MPRRHRVYGLSQTWGAARFALIGAAGMPDHLTFVIHSSDESSSLDLLVKSLEDIKRLIGHVDYAIYRRRPRRGWLVHSLKSSAPTITLTPEREDRQAVEIISDGLRLVTSETDQPPPYFTELALEDLRKMRRLFRGRDKARSVSLWVDGQKTATIREDIDKQADRILAAGYHNLGSVEGRLDAINVHRHPTATIWDRVSGSPVRWTFRREETEGVKSLLEKRVIVAGHVQYFSNGVPRRISNVVAFEDATPPQYQERAEFGSIPDERVQELGAAEWLKIVRGLEQ